MLSMGFIWGLLGGIGNMLASEMQVFPFCCFDLDPHLLEKRFRSTLALLFKLFESLLLNLGGWPRLYFFLSSSFQSNGLEACLYMLRQEYCGNLFNSSVPGTPLSTSYRYICGMCYCRFWVFVVYDFVMK